MPSKAEPIQRTTRVETPHRSARGRNRTKLSTTVAAENFTFLETMVNTGRSDSIAEAVDQAIARLRQMENRSRLERATTEYFASLTPEAKAEEQVLAMKIKSKLGQH